MVQGSKSIYNFDHVTTCFLGGVCTYRAALKGSSWVVWNWMNKLCFVYLLQAGDRNFFTHIHTTWEVPFRAALYSFAQGRVAVFGGKKQVSSSADGGGCLLRSFLSLSCFVGAMCIWGFFQKACPSRFTKHWTKPKNLCIMQRLVTELHVLVPEMILVGGCENVTGKLRQDW